MGAIFPPPFSETPQRRHDHDLDRCRWILSADPQLVPDAVVLEESRIRRRPSWLISARRSCIQAQWLRRSRRRSRSGSETHSTLPLAERRSTRRLPRVNPVKGFATVDGHGPHQRRGHRHDRCARRRQSSFGALRDVGVSVVMISQASSEHSICFAIPEVTSRSCALNG